MANLVGSTATSTEGCAAISTQIVIGGKRLMNAGRVLALVVFAFPLLTRDIPLATAQSCRWAGTAPLCNGGCAGDETEVTRLDAIPDFWIPPFVNINPPFGSNCATGTKALCCKTPGRSCRWDGTAPFCKGSCRSGETRSEPPPGSSSGSSCVTGSKVYCCSSAGSSSTGSTRRALTGTRDCSSGPDTCIQGFVWREAVPNDHVCVTPQVRQQTRSDNAQAAARRSPTGGPFGPNTCLSGFVWREAFSGDRVCVTPRTRAQAAQDNRWVRVRDACP